MTNCKAFLGNLQITFDELVRHTFSDSAKLLEQFFGTVNCMEVNTHNQPIKFLDDRFKERIQSLIEISKFNFKFGDHFFAPD